MENSNWKESEEEKYEKETEGESLIQMYIFTTYQKNYILKSWRKEINHFDINKDNPIIN